MQSKVAIAWSCPIKNFKMSTETKIFQKKPMTDQTIQCDILKPTTTDGFQSQDVFLDRTSQKIKYLVLSSQLLWQWRSSYITMKPVHRFFRGMNATLVFLSYWLTTEAILQSIIVFCFFILMCKISSQGSNLWQRGFFKFFFVLKKILINFSNKIHVAGSYSQHDRLSEFKAHLATSQCREPCRGCQPHQ